LLSHQVIQGNFYGFSTSVVPDLPDFQTIPSTELSKFAFPGIINSLLKEQLF